MTSRSDGSGVRTTRVRAGRAAIHAPPFQQEKDDTGSPLPWKGVSQVQGGGGIHLDIPQDTGRVGRVFVPATKLADEAILARQDRPPLCARENTSRLVGATSQTIHLTSSDPNFSADLALSATEDS